MREMQGDAKTIRELLSGSHYDIDFYQREYRWQTKHVHELIDDLAERFLADYKETDPRSAVETYGHYFLGSIILSDKGTKTYIIDGQQRLTTITLLLIYLHIRQGTRPDRSPVDDLILSERFGHKSFNLIVEERASCMEALYNQRHPAADHSESVRNIIARYDDIESLFPQDINVLLKAK